MALDAATQTTIAAIGAAVIPPVVSFIKRAGWSAQLKQLVALVASGIVAVVGIVVSGGSLTAISITQLTAMAGVGSQAVYGTYFKGSVVDTALSKIHSRPKTPKALPVATADAERVDNAAVEPTEATP